MKNNSKKIVMHKELLVKPLRIYEKIIFFILSIFFVIASIVMIRQVIITRRFLVMEKGLEHELNNLNIHMNLANNTATHTIHQSIFQIVLSIIIVCIFIWMSFRFFQLRKFKIYLAISIIDFLFGIILIGAVFQTKTNIQVTEIFPIVILLVISIINFISIGAYNKVLNRISE